MRLRERGRACGSGGINPPSHPACGVCLHSLTVAFHFHVPWRFPPPLIHGSLRFRLQLAPLRRRPRLAAYDLAFSSPVLEKRSHAHGFQSGRSRIDELYMGRARGGGSNRRLPAGDSQRELPATPSEDALSTPVTDAPDVSRLAAMLEEVMNDVAPPAPTPRLLRPYSSELY